MITKQQLLDSILNEIRVCRHLATKLTDKMMDYKPTENQRSTIEVLRYLASCAIGAMESLQAARWELYDVRENAVWSMTLTDFDEAMENQSTAIRQFFDALGDEELTGKIVRTPGAGELPLGLAIMRTSYAWLVAYRHELFLRAKLCGVSEVGTSNNWGGRDRKGA
jgi:hypothetical protein